jgi:hypothetical protein
MAPPSILEEMRVKRLKKNLNCKTPRAQSLANDAVRNAITTSDLYAKAGFLCFETQATQPIKLSGIQNRFVELQAA